MTDAERLSIIVPVYNEAGTMRAVIDRLRIELPIARAIVVADRLRYFAGESVRTEYAR